MPVTVRLSSRVPMVAARLPAALAAVVTKTATDLEAQAKGLAPVDTGNLRNSIQAVPQGPLAATVKVGAEYGIYVEFGTYKAPAQPFIVPATEAARPGFVAGIAQALRAAG